MLITLFLKIGEFALNIVLIPLSLVSYLFQSLPPLSAIINWLLTSLLYFGGIINIPALADVIIFNLTVIEAMVLYKLIFWVISLIPWLGDRIRDPLAWIVRKDPEYTETIPKEEVQSWYKR